MTDQTVKALLKEELLVPESDESRPARPLPTPNDEQSAALNKISDAIAQRRAERFLLFGVTGSGKTEVFLRAASEALKAGRSVLYLVPEIALTAQVVAQLRERFGERVASCTAASVRVTVWLLGTRPARRVSGGFGAEISPLCPDHELRTHRSG